MTMAIQPRTYWRNLKKPASFYKAPIFNIKIRMPTEMIFLFQQNPQMSRGSDLSRDIPSPCLYDPDSCLPTTACKNKAKPLVGLKQKGALIKLDYSENRELTKNRNFKATLNISSHLRKKCRQWLMNSMATNPRIILRLDQSKSKLSPLKTRRLMSSLMFDQGWASLLRCRDL